MRVDDVAGSIYEDQTAKYFKISSRNSPQDRCQRNVVAASCGRRDHGIS